jgi:hypothetical protein
MVDKSSHYEYLSAYVDDILIWRKDPMAVIKSLEKTYMLKSLGIPEYYLGGNVEFLGEAWKNQGLGLALSAKTYIQNIIPNFEYVDDILIWSKDSMAVIKSLEKTYMLKSVGIPEYYFDGNVEFLGEAWKNQGLGLTLSAKTYIQNIIPNF